MDESEIESYAESVERKRKGKLSRRFRRRPKNRSGISGHAASRYRERVGSGTIRQDAAEALSSGKQWFELPPGPIQEAMAGTVSRRPSKRLSLYHKGFVYVFGPAKKNRRRDLITVFPLKVEEESK